jgi:hypothetical protein
MSIPIPPLFDGASAWLVAAHASLTSAAASLMPGDVDAEFRFRRQFDGYLRTYIAEMEEVKDRLDRDVARVGRQHGTDSDAYRDAVASSQALVDLMPIELAQQNKARMGQLLRERDGKA